MSVEEITSKSEVHNLKHRWVLWYHKVDTEDWTIGSYRQLIVMETIEDYYKMSNLISNDIKDISAGMFFLMKEGVQPLWEDPSNKNGGYWSFRVLKKHGTEIWQDLTALLMGQTLTYDPFQIDYINGISFSPKISNAIFRIWINNARHSNIKKIITNTIPLLDTSSAIWKRYKK